MAIITHEKTNEIPDFTQADLDAQITAGFYPPGTTLADIVLPSDWNDAHIFIGTRNTLAGYDNSGASQDVILGTNLSFSGNILNATGGSGSPGGSQYDVQVNDGAGGFYADDGFTYDYNGSTAAVSIRASVNISNLSNSNSTPYVTANASGLLAVGNLGSNLVTSFNGSTGAVSGLQTVNGQGNGSSNVNIISSNSTLNVTSSGASVNLDINPTWASLNLVTSFNGSTGAVTGVSTFNGSTGSVTGVSTFNGSTGSVTGVSSFNSISGPVTGLTNINGLGNGSSTINFTSPNSTINIGGSLPNTVIIDIKGSTSCISVQSSSGGSSITLNFVNGIFKGTS